MKLRIKGSDGLHYTELTKAYKLHLLLEQLTKP